MFSFWFGLSFRNPFTFQSIFSLLPCSLPVSGGLIIPQRTTESQARSLSFSAAPFGHQSPSMWTLCSGTNSGCPFNTPQLTCPIHTHSCCKENIIAIFPSITVQEAEIKNLSGCFRHCLCGKTELQMGRASSKGTPGSSLSEALSASESHMYCRCKKSENLAGKRARDSWAAMLSNISLKNIMENACVWVKGLVEGASSGRSSTSTRLFFFSFFPFIFFFSFHFFPFFLLFFPFCFFITKL